MFMIDIDVPSHYSLLGVSPAATAAQIRKARDATVLELRTRVRQTVDPEHKAELTEREQAINAAAEVLARPEKREEYDREHPDLRLFTRRVAAAPLFTDPVARVDLLLRSINDHLIRAGAPLRLPSDLYRTDFAQDVTPNSLLDQLLSDRS
jgi:curved DNA-binding protein CbpA